MKRFQSLFKSVLCMALFTLMFSEIQAQKIVQFSEYKTKVVRQLIKEKL